MAWCLEYLLAGGLFDGNDAVSNSIKLAHPDLRVLGGYFFFALVYGMGAADRA
ncbi:MAG: hypothetical protein AAGI69_07625 [Cyanobacteria bacterium P01_H01_bin.21]